MAMRDIIEIDEELCDGCGECVPSCAEGALQIINGKARLVSDVLCDGMGACLGHCPTGALKVIQRSAAAFDEAAVASHMAARAPRAAKTVIPMAAASHAPVGGGCPGSRVQAFDATPRPPQIEPRTPSRHPANLGFIGLVSQTPRPSPAAPVQAAGPSASASASRLRQWPVQLHLVPPTAPFFQGRDVLLAADCVPVAVGDFHEKFLAGRSLAIACPKLDQHQEVYVQKLAAMMDEGGIQSLTVAIMEVPCCGGLLRLAQQALDRAERKVPLEVVTISIRGETLRG